MKKLGVYLLILLVTFLNVMPVFGLDTAAKIYDEAGLFSQREKNNLQEKAKSLAEGNQMDVVVVTTNDAQGKTSEAFADDFYDYNGFGYDKEASGVLLLIDMDNRRVHISTTGKAIRIFTDDRIDSILDDITPLLSEDKYAQAAEFFLDNVSYYFQKGIPSDQYNYDTETGEKDRYTSSPEYKAKRAQKNLPIYMLIGLGVGGIVVGIMAINNRGRKTTNSGTYLDKNSFTLMDNRDIYIRTAVTKRHIDTSSGSGGGGSRSSTHSGSSGRSHGGGGRSF